MKRTTWDHWLARPAELFMGRPAVSPMAFVTLLNVPASDPANASLHSVKTITILKGDKIHV